MANEIKQKQLEFLDWEFGAFFHFGIRTFNEGHRDWDMKQMELKSFNPSELDCDSWIETIKKAGANYAILVCKHHDGFANWPSKYTDYSVANTPWRNGQGDVVREFVDACTKYDVKVGLYYSPAEFGSKDKSAKDYDDYFINQITELLTGYGKVDYLWFDGCGSENHEYDTKRIIAAIRKMQPEILIFNMWDPDTRWVGNESGVAHMPNVNTVNFLDFSVQTSKKDNLDDFKFLPVECDFRMRLENWFYSDSDEDTVKSLDELMGLYYYSVGRGANFLINIGPDRRGKLPKKDSERLIEFGNEVKRRFSSPLSKEFKKGGNVYVCEFDKPKLVNHVVMKECMTSSASIDKYIVKAYPYTYGDPITVYQSNTIGHKAICQFPTIFTNKIEIEVLYEVDSNITEIFTYYVD